MFKLTMPHHHGLKRGDKLEIEDTYYRITKVRGIAFEIMRQSDWEFEKAMFWLAGAAGVFYLYVCAWHLL